MIIDDEGEPVLEGQEMFSVSLTTADLSSVIGEKSTTLITIDDSDLDGMWLMSFAFYTNALLSRSEFVISLVYSPDVQVFFLSIDIITILPFYIYVGETVENTS